MGASSASEPSGASEPSEFSDDARVMVRPFRTYAALAALGSPDTPARAVALRIGFFLFVLAGFVSLLSAGRLVAFHLIGSMVAWSFVPAVQVLAFTLAWRSIGGAARGRLLPALSLYFTGHGPWLLFLLAISAMCLFAPNPYLAFTALLSTRALPVMMLATIAWSMVLTFACFRAGLGLPRGRSFAATALFYLAFSGTIVGYYLAMNEIQPQAPWAQR
jgi:hypothetical protein